MSVIIGSARISENGTVNGKAGDQKQKNTPDYGGEVARQEFYVSSKGWYVLRPKNRVHAHGIAMAMARACDNPNIGYSQSDRYGVVRNGTDSKVPTNGDCSSLIRQCVKEGVGIDVGDFTTANEASKLMATGLFTKHTYSNGMVLLEGDILVTCTKGHTVAVISGESEPKKSVQEVAKEVCAGKWGNNPERRERLEAAGYNYEEVRAEVNRIMKAEEKPASHVSQKCVDLIHKYEGCRLKAYRLAGERYWSIGYGRHNAQIYEGMTITQAQADAMLKEDLITFEGYVKKYVKSIVLTQNRLDSLVSYSYNRGIKGIKQLAENCKTVQEIADGFLIYWGSATKYKDALIKRRKEERALFLSNN